MLERAGLLPPSCSWGKGRDWLRGISPDSDTVLLSPEPDTLSEPFPAECENTCSALFCVQAHICNHICRELALLTRCARQGLHTQGHVARSMLQKSMQMRGAAG